MAVVASAQGRLRGRGLRVTRPRTTVLDVLDEAVAEGEHLAVVQVADRARAVLGSLSLQAVYDCLQALVRVGLARRIEPAGHPARYEGRVGDNHHHLICRECGSMSDVDCVVGAAPCLQLAEKDFVVDEAEVIFWGRCSACVSRPSADPPTIEPASAPTNDREESR